MGVPPLLTTDAGRSEAPMTSARLRLRLRVPLFALSGLLILSLAVLAYALVRHVNEDSDSIHRQYADLLAQGYAERLTLMIRIGGTGTDPQSLEDSLTLSRESPRPWESIRLLDPKGGLIAQVGQTATGQKPGDGLRRYEASAQIQTLSGLPLELRLTVSTSGTPRASLTSIAPLLVALMLFGFILSREFIGHWTFRRVISPARGLHAWKGRRTAIEADPAQVKLERELDQAFVSDSLRDAWHQMERTPSLIRAIDARAQELLQVLPSRRAAVETILERIDDLVHDEPSNLSTRAVRDPEARFGHPRLAVFLLTLGLLLLAASTTSAWLFVTVGLSVLAAAGGILWAIRRSKGEAPSQRGPSPRSLSSALRDNSPALAGMLWGMGAAWSLIAAFWTLQELSVLMPVAVTALAAAFVVTSVAASVDASVASVVGTVFAGGAATGLASRSDATPIPSDPGPSP